MSAKRSGNDVTNVSSSQFLDIYPVCSNLIAEIGRAFIRTWSTDEVISFQSQFLELLDRQGVPQAKSALAWKLVLQDHVDCGHMPLDVPDAWMAAVSDSPVAQSPTEEVGRVEQVPVAHENVFSYEGGRWVVCFEGKTVYPQDITGIKYIHFLISNPGKVFSPRELYEGFGGRKSGNQPRSMSAGDAIHSGVEFKHAQSDVLIDQRGKDEMLVRLDVIEKEMIAAKAIPDADLIETLATERIAIKEQLRKAFTPVGSRRIQEPELVRRMKAVDIAIRRAKEKIERSGHDALLRHLDDTVEVKVKSGCRYSSQGATWRTDSKVFIAPNRPR